MTQARTRPCFDFDAMGTNCPSRISKIMALAESSPASQATSSYAKMPHKKPFSLRQGTRRRKSLRYPNPFAWIKRAVKRRATYQLSYFCENLRASAVLLDTFRRSSTFLNTSIMELIRSGTSYSLTRPSKSLEGSIVNTAPATFAPALVTL